MDSFELSKIAGAVLAALLLIVGTGVLIESNQGSHGSEVGYVLPGDTSAKPADHAAAAPAAGGEAAHDAGAPAPAAGAANPAPVAAAAAGGFNPAAVVALLAAAKPEEGKAAFKKCASCHQVEKGKPSAVAPNLYGVVNRAKGGQPDYAAYSEAMKAKGGEWTYESLANFIHKPKGYIAGTKMIFNGVNEPADIANIIAYLRTLSDAPAPLPN